MGTINNNQLSELDRFCEKMKELANTLGELDTVIKQVNSDLKDIQELTQKEGN